MDTKNILERLEKAERSVEMLEDFSRNYNLDYESFIHTNNFSSEIGGYGPVRQERIVELSDQLVNMMEEHEEIKQELEEVQPDDISEHLMFEGETWSSKTANIRKEETLEKYRNVFESIWSTAYRVRENPNIPCDPINQKYERWRQEQIDRDTDHEESMKYLFNTVLT